MVDTSQPVLLLLIRVMLIPFHFKVYQMLVDLLQPRLTPDAIYTLVSYGNIKVVGHVGIPQTAIIVPCPGKDFSYNVFCPFFIPNDVKRAKEQF